MTTSSSTTPTATAPTAPATPRVPLRLRLTHDSLQGAADGYWWPQSRDLQTESADLVDHFPAESGRISRMLFSRPDWDGTVTDGRGTRMIHAARGRVKVGSFPSDDTRLMVLAMAGGGTLRLVVIPPDTPSAEAEALLGSAGA